MSLSVDSAQLPHLSQHQKEVTEHMAQELGDQALANLLSCPLEQHVPQLKQFEKFVLGQRMSASKAQSHEVAESISKTHDELLREQDRNKALNRTVESLSARSIQSRLIKMEPPKFDGTAASTIAHWLLAVEQCGVAQPIEDDTRMVSYAMSHLRGKASEWAYSALMAHSKAFPSWVIFKTTIRAMYQPPNNEVLLQARFFSSRQAQRSLQGYVQEMRSLSASISVGLIPEHIKVPTCLNGLQHDPARQTLFRKVPSTMEESIEIALFEQQSYNSASVTPWQKPTTERSAAAPMELGNADGVCYNCDQRGHMMARCYAKVGASAKASSKKPPNPNGGAKNHRARRSDSALTKTGSGNAVAQ
uniref:CCHC-type domain-containing protein n=1 Tax=Hyaloperonospora arabidopsidis (strain Emoy2) TaxID=559515 RepID=M4B7A8_HYAAE